MSLDLEQKIANVRRLIREVETEIDEVERENRSIRDELAAFERRYNRIVKPIADQLDAVKKAIETLREQQFGNWMNFGQNGNRQNRRGALPGQMAEDALPDDILPSAKKSTGKNPKHLKQLYRALARQYHPDLAKNEQDGIIRTKMMQIINAAYKEGDVETLATLSESDVSNSTVREAVGSNAPLNVLTLRRLQAEYEELAARLRVVREAKSELRYGALMQLKIEESLARARGENLLKQLAEEMEQEYWQRIKELDTLQNRDTL